MQTRQLILSPALTYEIQQQQFWVSYPQQLFPFCLIIGISMGKLLWELLQLHCWQLSCASSAADGTVSGH